MTLLDTTVSLTATISSCPRSLRAIARLFDGFLPENGNVRARFVPERSSHSAAIPTATRAAPRASTGAACCQRAGSGRASLLTGRREVGCSSPQTSQNPSSNGPCEPHDGHFMALIIGLGIGKWKSSERAERPFRVRRFGLPVRSPASGRAVAQAGLRRLQRASRRRARDRRRRREGFR